MDVQIPCPCPAKGDGTPRHEHDTITLRDKLDFHRATTITKAISLVDTDDDESRAAEILATLSEFYVLMGVESWSLRDVSNKSVDVSRSAIRQYLLGDPATASIVVEAADALYNEAILLPLLAKASNSSPPSPTNEPTSPKPAGAQPKRPRQLRPSSTSSTPTDDTATTSSSLDGDSSFLQSGTTAA